MNRLRENIKNARSNEEVEKEAETFASQYGLWIITDGQKYINALSKDFDSKMETVKYFKENIYGTNWIDMKLISEIKV